MCTVANITREELVGKTEKLAAKYGLETDLKENEIFTMNVLGFLIMKLSEEIEDLKQEQKIQGGC